MVCLIVVDILQLYLPLLTAQAVDALRMSDSGRVHQALIWMAVLAVLIAAIRYVWRLLLLGASRKIERDLRDDFFSKLLRLPQPALDVSRSGDLLSLSTNDIGVIRQFLGLGMMSLCDSIVLVIYSLFLMMTLSVKLTLLVAIPLPLVALSMGFLAVRLHAAHDETQTQFGDLSARLQEDLYGVRLLRACGQETNRHRKFVAESESYRQKSMAVIRLQGFFYPLMKFLTGLATVLVIAWGGREVIQGRLTLGQFVAFSEYVAMLSWPLMAMGWIINLVQRARASMGRICHVLDDQSSAGSAAPRLQVPASLTSAGSAPPAPTAARLDPDGSGTRTFRVLAIRNLTQSVEGARADGEPVSAFRFVGLTLTIRRGEWVGVAGRTASGKSALADRILRIYDPPAGSILLDDTDITGIDERLLRDRISYVPQDGFLFSQSLASNFKLGARRASDDDVSEIARAVQIQSEIDQFPDGLKTRVGERGVTLSGGQRQRVALGRALLKDADFYILDDPFSSVDVDTEERIFDQLKTRLRGRGVLLISHRIRSLARMDRIVVLDGGTVAESGTHEELLARGGLYSRLAESQILEDRLLPTGGGR